MDEIAAFYRRYELFFIVVLLALAGVLLSIGLTSSLVDYDEATYAKIVVDTIHSGDITTFTLSGHHWFEKPPLYLWLAIASVKLFGIHEFAFRLPGILAAIVCLWLTYLITRRLTNSPITAAAAFLLLLSTSTFYHFSVQARLDSSVVMMMLAALFFWIKGWEDKRYLIWVMPAIAVGFLFKSFVAVLIIPVIFMYSYFYGQWRWLRSSNLWMGLPLALLVVLPWHIEETVRFGSLFWKDYFGYQILHRSVAQLTGMGNYYDYLKWQWDFEGWRFILFIAMAGLFIALSFLKKFRTSSFWKHLAAPLLAVLFFGIFFTLIRTHLSPYILPAMPFMALFLASTALYLAPYVEELAPIFIVVLLFIGIYNNTTPANAKVTQDEQEEASIGQLYKQLNQENPAPVYTLDWPFLETLNYYGDTAVTATPLTDHIGRAYKGPVYLIVPLIDIGPLFFTRDGKYANSLTADNVKYRGQVLFLFYLKDGIVLTQ